IPVRGFFRPSGAPWRTRLFPWLAPWATFSRPSGADAHESYQQNVETPEGGPVPRPPLVGNPGTDGEFPANCAGNSLSVPGLEVEPQAELHVAGSAGGAGDAAKRGGRRDRHRRSAHHHMVQHVGELDAEVGAHAFAKHCDGLVDTQVDVPARQGAHGVAAAIAVEAEDALAELSRSE